MGPLHGLRILELAGLGPAPHATMILADWGAEVVRVARKGWDGTPADLVGDPQLRNRVVTAADLKDSDDVASVLELVARADVLIEGFRPQVTERLGLGPEQCLERNPRLIYARMTGWGQHGPLAHAAGHDINYLAITGMLAAIGEPDRPTVPLSLIADYGGGSMYLVASVLGALFERERSGRGQVLDIAMLDGVNTLAQNVWAFRSMGFWEERRGANILDGGAPYYTVYRCSDQQFIAVGAIEQQFYTALVSGLGLDTSQLPSRDDKGCWPELRQVLARAFASQTRDHWAAVFENIDACVTPILTMSEAVHHPHQQARGAFGSIDGVLQTMPGQVFSRTTLDTPRAPGSSVERLADLVAKAWDAEHKN